MTAISPERDCERSRTFASRLRALADVIESNPGLQLPYDVRISASTVEDLERWSAALTAAGHDITDSTDDHHRSLTSLGVLDISKVHDDAMRRYYAERDFLKEHAAEVDSLIAEVPA
jgi:hypothetical protein